MTESRAAFGPFQIDRVAKVVLRRGEPLPVGLRGFRLLEALLRRPGDVLTKAELMDAAWGEAAVEESNLSVQIALVRKALGVAPGGGDWIATVPRVGYRLVGPSEAREKVRGTEQPSIAVLPFANLSSDPDQSFFTDGLAEEIITALSRLPNLLVIARTSTFAYRGDQVDTRRVGEDLDVGFVLTGSVRRAGNHLRMSVQLADVKRSFQVWAESYDRELSDVFAVQDDVTRQVVDVLQVRLTEGGDQTGAARTRDVSALDLFLRGRSILSSPEVNAAKNAEGIELLRQALERVPDYVEPRVSLVIGLVTNASNLWAELADTIAEARRVADEGLAIAPTHPDMRAASALVALLEKDHERCREDSGIAASLNPLGSFVNIMRGGFLVNDAQPRLAIPCYEQAMRADPGMSHLYMHHLATAYLIAHSFETAAALYRSRIVLSPRTDMSRAYLCAALGHLGLFEEARRVWAELLSINPRYSLAERLAMWSYRDASYPLLLLEGLQKAGLRQRP